ncbi:PREDICTED: importin-13-like [Amphimedon queenslandica]|uniref:Uncharacterized protein n=2 Tax=Amphimedon queenslandica TaxID=400682 RepID=A0AAN0JDV1_AMPQE|nr:PREDICTED: importin-13-like [Amphimedon queenslandica]|eukprot:XP_019855174.1 PREDICTED: importin-13-like [Amphimedon queenslandica]
MVKMEGMANNAFNICLASLQLPEQQSMSSASSLMVSIIKHIPTLDFVREIISRQGLSLVEFILRGVAGGVDRSRLDLLVNILHQLSIQCVTELSTWLQVLLSKQGFPTVQASSLEKQVFMQSVLRARGDKETLRHKVSEFSLICRGFHGTIYAIETSRSLP